VGKGGREFSERGRPKNGDVSGKTKPKGQNEGPKNGRDLKVVGHPRRGVGGQCLCGGKKRVSKRNFGHGEIKKKKKKEANPRTGLVGGGVHIRGEKGGQREVKLADPTERKRREVDRKKKDS